MAVRTLLLDADSLCYSLAAVHQTVMPWTPELYTYKGDLSGAKAALGDFIDRTMERCSCTELKVALSDTRANFRKRLLGKYKANRIGKEKPVLFKALRDELKVQYGAEVKPNLEGDDLVAMWATSPELRGKSVVCSIDKDCKQIPGWLYNPNKDQLESISPSKAFWFFLEQTVTGDRVDGYEGCPGIGPKRVLSVLDGNPVHVWDRIVETYEKAGLNEAVAIENARCAWLLKHGDLREDGAIKLWHPRGEDEWLVMN